MHENPKYGEIEKKIGEENEINERFKFYRFGSNFMKFLVLKEERMKEKESNVTM